jgi:hypothetical protein
MENFLKKAQVPLQFVYVFFLNRQKSEVKVSQNLQKSTEI